MNPHQGPHNTGFQTSQLSGYSMPMPGVPAMGYPPPQPGFSNIGPGYPSNNPQAGGLSGHGQQGYPNAIHPQYPQTQPVYPQQQLGYPQTQPVYPQQQLGYPQIHPAYPQTQAKICQVTKSKPTVVPVNPFNARDDAAVLHKAMKGLGTDEKAIIKVLTRRSNEQRLWIATEFKTVYDKDLVAELKSETSGKFRDLLVVLMTPLAQFYAKELHEAMEGIGTDEDLLIEIMCSVSNREINNIKQAYTAMYKKTLDADLRGDTSGYFRKLLVSLSMGTRSEDFYVDQAKANEDARSLLKAGKLRLGTDESVFNQILCSRSFPQLAAIFKEYQVVANHDIEKAIKDEFSGDIEKALLTIVKIAYNRAGFFAEKLHKSMKGLGTNDRQLMRIMVTRCEVDLKDIAEMFQLKYGDSLEKWIEGDCSGDYKKCLLGLLGQ